jgi:hypothetical protein
VGRGGLSEGDATLEGEVTVRCVLVDGGLCPFHGDGRRAQIGVEVLHAQQLGIVRRIGAVTHVIDPDAGDVLKATHRHGSSSGSVDSTLLMRAAYRPSVTKCSLHRVSTRGVEQG